MTRYISFPRTEPPPDFGAKIVGVFKKYENTIATLDLPKGLTSDQVLQTLAPDLISLGFTLETGKGKTQRVERPVFFGEDGKPTLRYQIDGFHSDWKCGLEVEAGRAWMGNAVYRDLIQASVMVNLAYLCLAVPNTYRFNAKGRQIVSRDYENTRDVADALYGHSRLKMPYGLLLIGY